MSLQKYATTATSVPRWSATSNVWLKRSCCSRYVQSAAHGTRMRCPDDEIGSSSVSPWTTPRTSACPSVSAEGSSPTPRSVRTTASTEGGARDAEDGGAAHGGILRLRSRLAAAEEIARKLRQSGERVA